MTHKKLIKKTEEYAESVEKAANDPGKSPEENRDPGYHLTRKEMNHPEVEKIVPLRRIRSLGRPNPKWEKQRAYENEYVVGMLENVQCPNQALNFWKNNLPGDDYAEWYIPAGRPVAVPRHIANHLAKNCKYHTFKNIPKPKGELGPDTFTDKFEIIETKSRIDFKPINAFG